MSFNPDPSKQDQEVIFSYKIKKRSHPSLIFNHSQVIQTLYQNHLGMFLDDKLNFGQHLKYIANKANKFIRVLRKPQSVKFDQAYNKSFHENLEIFQYNASLAITGAIRGTSKEKLYQKLGFVDSSLSRRFSKINLSIIFMSYYLLKPLLTAQDRVTICFF